MRDDLRFQVVERLAAPVLLAVAGGDPRDVAALMNRIVQFSIELGGILSGPGGVAEGGEARRVALAALSGLFMAGLYERNGLVPDEAEQARLAPALETILAFADQFIPENPDEAQAMAARLRALPAGAPLWDDDQAVLQYIGAMAPAVQAITDFSFSFPEHKLAQDVAARVSEKAAQLQIDMFGTAGADAAYRQKMALTGILAGLYAQCHKAARDALWQMAAGQDMPSAQSTEDALSGLWASWERQAAMLVVLARAFGGGGGGGGQRAETETGEARPVPVAPQADTPINAQAGPMSFFRPGAAKKTDQDGGIDGDFAE